MHAIVRTSFGIAVISVALAVAGCAGSDSNPSAASAEVSSFSARRVVMAPRAADVATEYMVLVTAAFDQAKAAHPEVTTLSKETAQSFTHGAVYLPDLDTVLDRYFEDHPAIATSEFLAAFGPFAKAQISAAAGTDGVLGEEIAEVPRGLGGFFGQARDTFVQVMLASYIKPSAVISPPAMLTEWDRVEAAMQDTGFDLYQVEGAPKPGAILKALGLPEDLVTTTKGPKAVDRFFEFVDSLDAFDDFKAMLKSSKAQFAYEYDDDGQGGIDLAIVDDQGQMFVFSLRFYA